MLRVLLVDDEPFILRGMKELIDWKNEGFEIVGSVCETEVSFVTEESTIGDFPQWDSMGHLTILSNVEEAFDINFEPEEMMDLEDVHDIIEAVENKLA